jgi:hypothetical protein
MSIRTSPSLCPPGLGTNSKTLPSSELKSRRCQSESPRLRTQSENGLGRSRHESCT